MTVSFYPQAILHILLAGVVGLNGRPDANNVHICGEAYSDFQGFIEGALRSAKQVCARIEARAGVDSLALAT